MNHVRNYFNFWLARALGNQDARRLFGYVALSLAALAAMLALLGDETPHSIRFQAAKWILEAAGLGLAATIPGERNPSEEMPLSEMCYEELEEFVRRNGRP